MSSEDVLTILGAEATRNEYNAMIEALDSYGFTLFFEKFLQPITDELMEQVDEAGIIDENYEQFLKDCASHSTVCHIKTASERIKEAMKEFDKVSQK
tara:strand:- start:383 stop:673 length:291 start_codon:yes stop_codon:yes gene_type:complete